MYDEAWKQFFFEDNETKRALASSEVYRNYISAETQREALRNDPVRKAEKKLNEELKINAELEEFQKKVNASPILRARLQIAKEALRKNPELVKTTDPNFVKGLNLLNLGDE
jgi:hypothetical protein